MAPEVIEVIQALRTEAVDSAIAEDKGCTAKALARFALTDRTRYTAHLAQGLHQGQPLTVAMALDILRTLS